MVAEDIVVVTAARRAGYVDALARSALPGLVKGVVHDLGVLGPQHADAVALSVVDPHIMDSQEVRIGDLYTVA